MIDSPQAARSLQAHSLSCERGDRELIRDLNLEIKPGKLVLVEGSNGSGKTTLLRTLCGLRTPGAGRITWCGEDIRHFRSEYHAELNYIGHLPGIKDDLSAIENLQIGCQLQTMHADIDLMDVLDKVGLFGFEELPCRTLSAGQRRRVALARLWAIKAPLWILDEPFNAIDKKGVELLLGLLESHINNKGLVVLTTHQHLDIGEGRLQRLNLNEHRAQQA